MNKRRQIKALRAEVARLKESLRAHKAISLGAAYGMKPETVRRAFLSQGCAGSVQAFDFAEIEKRVLLVEGDAV